MVLLHRTISRLVSLTYTAVADFARHQHTYSMFHHSVYRPSVDCLSFPWTGGVAADKLETRLGRNCHSPDQQSGIHCLIICTIQLLTPNSLGGTCSLDIRSVSALEVLCNSALQIDICLLAYFVLLEISPIGRSVFSFAISLSSTTPVIPLLQVFS